MVHVGDLRQKPLQSATAHGVLVRETLTDEGVLYPLYQHELLFTVDCMGRDMCLLWPALLTHRITEASPLWHLNEEDIQKKPFEIIVFLEGVVETTGEMCQARTSYTQQEVFWGYRFEQILSFQKNTKRWCVDFTRFDEINTFPTPKLSAKDMSVVYKDMFKWPCMASDCPETGSGILLNSQFNAHLPEGISQRTQQLLDSMTIANCPSVPATLPIKMYECYNPSDRQERRLSM